MRDYYAAQDAPRPTISQAAYLTPYLGLRARLSQIWINRWTILLLLVLIRTLLAVGSLDDGLDSARRQALSACTSVESMGSAMASMPHYMSQGVNELAASGVERAVNGLMSMLTLTVTGVEEIVLFVVNLLTQTYVCLITLAVSGSLRAALDVIEGAADAINGTLDSIADDISDGVDGFKQRVTDMFNGIEDGINGVSDLFGGDDFEMPELDLTADLNKLRDFRIPSGLDQGLETLNRSIPTFDDVRNITSNLIRAPFQDLKRLINESVSAFEFNRSVFPVPQREQLSFCSESNGINDFFDSLVEIEVVARRVFIGVITTLAILACVPMAWREIKRWRLMQRRAQLVNRNAVDPLDVVYISSRPYSSTLGIKLANRYSNVRSQTLVRWAVAYATSTPALFVLSLGVAGLAACLCQYILLQAIKKEVPELTNQVGAFADQVVLSLNNASEQWALSTNRVILDTNAELNEEVFGWVNTSTTAVNETLNQFVDTMTDALDRFLGDGPLREPVQEVLNCLILLKIEGIQRGLTWVHDNAHIDFPLFPNDTFSLGAVASLTDSDADDSFLASPSSVASDEISDAVVRMINKIEAGIREEAIISTCIILIWVIVVLIGFCRSAFFIVRPGKTRAEGGQAYHVDPATDNLRGHDNYVPPATGAAPPYSPPVNHAAPYAIVPRPFPTFEPATSERDGDANEKLQHVGASRNVGVAVTQPTHERKSSCGDVSAITPIERDEKSRDPFVNINRF